MDSVFPASIYDSAWPWLVKSVLGPFEGREEPTIVTISYSDGTPEGLRLI
jgi:hypothetical protein